jgi:hypothetical protein
MNAIFYLPPEAAPTRHTVKYGEKTLNPMGRKRTGVSFVNMAVKLSGLKSTQHSFRSDRNPVELHISVNLRTARESTKPDGS